jgi:speckle-type POZ protein
METQKIANNSAPSTQSKQTPPISSVSTSYLCQTEGVINKIDLKLLNKRLAIFGILIGMGFVIFATSMLHKTQTRDSDKPDLILFLSQLEELFEKMLFSDVTFNVRGQKFAAHKNILAMRSPVFAAMFQHPTKELQTGEVEVEDVDPDVFQEVLRYLYTGLTRSTAMDVMATGLLVAADKYLLDELKNRCETHLIRQMSAKNCLDLLTLTTHNPAEHLKKYAIEFFRRYPGKFTLKSF